MKKFKTHRTFGWVVFVVLFVASMGTFANEQYGLWIVVSLGAGTIFNLIRDQKKLVAMVVRDDES